MLSEPSSISETSPAWIHLVSRVDTVEHKLDDASAVSKRTERAIIGGYDDSGTVWRPGMREKIEVIDKKVDDAKSAAFAFQGLGKWALGVLSAILIGVTVEGLNTVFGWWGSAHAAINILKGHH